MIDNAWGFDPASAPFDVRFHNANYLLFGRYTDNVNNSPFSPLFQGTGQPQQDLNSTEAKFQFSFKARLWTTDDRRWGLWAAYTQQSQWQLYNGDTSRPFPKPKSGRIAVKVINHLGDEVMKVFRA